MGFGFLGSWLGYILWGAFHIFRNFGLAIIVFTLVIKLALFPFSIKQQKSMAGTARLSKKQRELQEKYANNQQKYQEELGKLYEREGVNPMGGCATMFLPLLVLFGIFYAVAYPLTNTLHLDVNDVNNAIAYINTIPGYATTAGTYYQEISLINIFPNICNTPAIMDIFSVAEIDKINFFYTGFNAYGVDLLVIPKDIGLFSWYTLFPILSFVSNVGTTLISQKVNGTQATQQQGCMKVMLYTMPLFTAYLAYTVPSAVAFYWIISSVLSLLQTVLLGKIFSATNITAKAEARHAALLFENEAKVPYVYAPSEAQGNNNLNTKKKKK
ncbi:MAG: YidC/Oxa1 family membrane protein insertase [Ruminococcus sp.]|nr:YidC/Oxa1 family membrane protein insertase [Ruminococcus sp.]